MENSRLAQMKVAPGIREALKRRKKEDG